MQETTMKFEISKSGKSVYWECGGAGTNTGFAEIICNSDGSKKTALFFKHGGHLAKGQHALFVANTGDFLISVYQHKGDVEISVMHVWDIIETTEKYITRKVSTISNFKNEEWDIEPPEYLDAAIRAAVDKSFDYHCRSVYYGIEKPKRYTNN
jgi:hypothetical protein